MVETNNLYQLINEGMFYIDIRNEGMSYIDLIISDQPYLFTESGVHPSLDEHCQHQIMYGKLNISIPYLPAYNRTLWDYANVSEQIFFILNLKIFTKTNYLRHYLQHTLLHYKDDTPRSIMSWLPRRHSIKDRELN